MANFVQFHSLVLLGYSTLEFKIKKDQGITIQDFAELVKLIVLQKNPFIYLLTTDFGS